MAKPRWVSKLPKWAEYNAITGRIDVDPDVVYPLFLDGAVPTQVRLEMARMKLTKILRDEIVPEGAFLSICILTSDYRWRLSNFPMGEGEMPNMVQVSARE